MLRCRNSLLLNCSSTAPAAAVTVLAACRTCAEHKCLDQWVDQVRRLILRAVAHAWQLHKLRYAWVVCKQAAALSHILPRVVRTPQYADRHAWWHLLQQLLRQGPSRVGDEVQEHINGTGLQGAKSAMPESAAGDGCKLYSCVCAT